MPPRHQTLPPAQTSSARQAMQSFYCQLCKKGYSRMNDYEAHLSSYDHSHKQRLKDMKAMVRDPNAAARARRQEAKADAVVSILVSEGTGGNNNGGAGTGTGTAPAGAGFKKGGFKKTGFKAAFVPVGDAAAGPVRDNAESIIVDETGRGMSMAASRGREGPGGKEEVGDDDYSPNQLIQDDSDEDEGYEVYDPRFPTD